MPSQERRSPRWIVRRINGCPDWRQLFTLQPRAQLFTFFRHGRLAAKARETDYTIALGGFFQQADIWVVGVGHGRQSRPFRHNEPHFPFRARILANNGGCHGNGLAFLLPRYRRCHCNAGTWLVAAENITRQRPKTRTCRIATAFRNTNFGHDLAVIVPDLKDAVAHDPFEGGLRSPRLAWTCEADRAEEWKEKGEGGAQRGFVHTHITFLACNWFKQHTIEPVLFGQGKEFKGVICTFHTCSTSSKASRAPSESAVTAPFSIKVTLKLSAKFDLLPDAAIYDVAAEALYALAFGPGRHVKAAARLREGHRCCRDVSFVALAGGQLIGACRLWPLVTDQGQEALFLGPIAVAPDQQGQGLGGKLVEACLEASDRLTRLPVILVGDLAFFDSFGFQPVPKGRLILPGPADPNRLLWRQVPGAEGQPPAGRLLKKA